MPTVHNESGRIITALFPGVSGSVSTVKIVFRAVLSAHGHNLWLPLARSRANSPEWAAGRIGERGFPPANRGGAENSDFIAVSLEVPNNSFF